MIDWKELFKAAAFILAFTLALLSLCLALGFSIVYATFKYLP